MKIQKVTFRAYSLKNGGWSNEIGVAFLEQMNEQSTINMIVDCSGKTYKKNNRGTNEITKHLSDVSLRPEYLIV